MECQNCGSLKTNVIDSRKVEMNVFRIRKCSNCGYKFYTEEVEISTEEAAAYVAAVKRKYRESKRKVLKKNE